MPQFSVMLSGQKAQYYMLLKCNVKYDNVSQKIQYMDDLGQHYIRKLLHYCIWGTPVFADIHLVFMVPWRACFCSQKPAI